MAIIDFIKRLISKIVNIFKSDKNVKNTSTPTLSTITTEPSVERVNAINIEYILGKIKEISNSIHSTLYSDILAKVKEAYLHNSKDVIFDIDGDSQITINDITTLTYFWDSINNPIDLSYYIKSSDSSSLDNITYFSYLSSTNNINYEESYGFCGHKLINCSFKSSGKTFPINYIIPKRTVIGTLKPYSGFNLPSKVSIVPGNYQGTVNQKNGNVSLSKDTPMAQYGLGINATCTKISYYI